MSEEQPTLYAGVDGGGTKTLAHVTDDAFRVLGEGRAGPSNFLRAGLEPAALAVERALCLACIDAGVRLDEIATVGIGLAGVNHPTHHRTMLNALRRRVSVRPMLLVGDTQAAVAGATDLEPGVVIISGTGSVAYGIDGSGRTAQAGGWGPVMGDEGSGYDISRHALAAVAGSHDGRLPPTSLTPRVCAHFGVATVADLLTVVYDPDRRGRLELSSLSTIVADEARAGDAVARDILARAGRELGATVAAVIRRLDLERSSFRVAYVGGVFNSAELVLDPLRETIAAVAPFAEVAPPLFGPTIGAAKLAARNLRRPDARRRPASPERLRSAV